MTHPAVGERSTPDLSQSQRRPERARAARGRPAALEMRCAWRDGWRGPLQHPPRAQGLERPVRLHQVEAALAHHRLPTLYRGAPHPGGGDRRRPTESAFVGSLAFGQVPDQSVGMDFLRRRSRRKGSQSDGLATLDQVAQNVSTLLASGSTGAAWESALNELVPAARAHLDRYRSMTATVPNTLWTCSDSAVEISALDVAAPLRLRATRFAMFAEATPGQQELVRPSNEMLEGSLQALLGLKKRVEPLENLLAERKLQMIDTMTWPYLRSSKELFKGAAELMSMLYRAHDQGLRLLAIALGLMALDLEPFIPPHDLDGRLAAQETRFWAGLLLCAVEPVNYEGADDYLRQGITCIIDLDQPGVAVDSRSLAPALNALKLLLLAAGHLSPLATLEMAFDGLEQIKQFTLEMLPVRAPKPS